MSKNTKAYLITAFIAVFFVVGFFAFKEALPEDKNQRVYNILKPYLPYELEKRLGGLTIIYKDGREKEKPKSANIFLITDEIDKEWGREYLRVKNGTLEILDKDKNILKSVEVSQDELAWLRSFFGENIEK